MKNSNILIIGIIAFLGFLYYKTESLRAIDGITSYYSNAVLTTQSSILYILLSGLIIGFIVAKVIGGKK